MFFLTKIANKTKFYCIEIGDQKICLKKVSQFLKMLDLNSYKYLCPNITVQFCADKPKVISLKKGGYVAKRQHKYLHKASIHGSINFHANAFASEVKESRIRASLKPHKFLGKTQQTRRKLISERS